MNEKTFLFFSGYHILSADLSQCPFCQFPGIRSELLKVAKASENCPMCANELNGDMSKFPQMKLTEIKTIGKWNL